MMMAVIVIMVVRMVAVRSGSFRLRITLHEGLDDLAQGVLVERQMAGEQAREPREDERLVGEARVTLVRTGLLAVARAAAERVGEALLHRGEGVIGRGGLSMTRRLPGWCGIPKAGR